MSDEGKSFSDRKSPKKPRGQDRGQRRPMPTSTITRPGQAKEGQPPVTASTPQASNKRKVEPLKKTNIIFEAKVKVKSNEGVLPPQPAAVGGRLSEFVEGWKHISSDPLCLKYHSQAVQTSFYESTPPSETPWEIRSPQGLEEILGMWEKISLMLQKNAITEVPSNSPGFYLNVFLLRKASGRSRPVIDIKSLNAHIWALHLYTTSSVLSTVQKGDYTF